MLCSDVVDKLLDEHRLSYSGTSEESDFSTPDSYTQLNYCYKGLGAEICAPGDFGFTTSERIPYG